MNSYTVTVLVSELLLQDGGAALWALVVLDELAMFVVDT